jgi:acetyltransferase-like isoleucine patch superfamily enzyme
MLKSTLKMIAQTVALVLLLPLYLVYWLFSLADKDKALAACSQFLSLFPGITGSYLRVAFCRLAMSECSADAFIGFGTLFSQQQTSIGAGVYIGPQSNIGKSRIGNNCLLGSAVHIMSGKGQHNFDALDTPIREQGGHFETITIGEDCWIGNGALIMANVGKKCIIGAGSVVTQDIPDYSIAAGNPAKVIKSRLENT